MDLSQHEEGMSAMQEVKRRFFALRNGVVADLLRKNGSPFRIIFGLNLPQIKDIAIFVGTNRELSEALWANTNTRESLLLAPLIYPKNEMDERQAEAWLDACPSTEIIDTLCHGLLRHQAYAGKMALRRISESEGDTLKLYGALRLILNVLPMFNKEELQRMRSSLEGISEPKMLKRQIMDEIDFLSSD